MRRKKIHFILKTFQISCIYHTDTKNTIYMAQRVVHTAVPVRRVNKYDCNTNSWTRALTQSNSRRLLTEATCVQCQAIVCVVFMVKKIALGQFCIRVLWLSLVSTNPPMFSTYYFVHHLRRMILPTDRVLQ